MDQGRFCDVKLACEGGQTLRAHRSVLCASSGYFDAVLSSDAAPKETIVIMKDCKLDDLQLLIEFIYKGEISVEQVSGFG